MSKSKQRDPLEDLLDDLALDGWPGLRPGDIVPPKGDPRDSILAGDWCGNSPTNVNRPENQPDWIECLSSDRYEVQS